jgi:hypothetical protein
MRLEMGRWFHCRPSIVFGSMGRLLSMENSSLYYVGGEEWLLRGNAEACYGKGSSGLLEDS